MAVTVADERTRSKGAFGALRHSGDAVNSRSVGATFNQFDL
ncbi:hypothetical protein ACWGB8_21305 [Kitasatospora sp. NPDC054939]